MKAIVFVDVQKDFTFSNSKFASKIFKFAKTLSDDIDEYKMYATRHTEDSNYCIEMSDGWMIDEKLIDLVDGLLTIVNKTTSASFDLAEIIDEDQINNKIVFDEIILVGLNSVVVNAVLLRTKFPKTKIAIRKDLCSEKIDKSIADFLERCKIDII